MKEATIKYKNSKTLELLRSLSKFLDFSISPPKKSTPSEKKYDYINGVPAIPGDSSIDITELNKIFTRKNLDPRKLRTEGWQRQKQSAILM